MSYKSPHPAHMWLFSAALFICHDYKVRCQRRSVGNKKQILEETREIDLCARMASFFGPNAHLAAQGTNDIDVQIDGPTIRAEVKYFKPPATQFAGHPRRDWDWLLATSSTNDEFKKRAWVVFWPSTSSDMYKFTNCLSVPKTHDGKYCSLDFAPFMPYAEPELPPNGANQRLKFKEPPRWSLIIMPGGKRARVDIVGSHQDPLWCAIYTRTSGETNIPQQYHYRPTEVVIP